MSFSMAGYFQAVDEEGNPVKPERVAKPSEDRVLMSVRPDGRAISFFGDLHPSFSGNVVKAMGSAKRGYPVVSRILAKSQPATRERLAESLNKELRATVHEVVRLTPNIVEVVVKAPMAARAFQPGQFYRLQNFETLAHADRRTRRWRWKVLRLRALLSIASAVCCPRSSSRWADRPIFAPC